MAGGVGAGPAAEPGVALASIGWSLLLEAAAGEAWRRLAADGIAAILLKGPSIASWLYEGELRPARDVDLLVSPARFEAAQQSLAALGYSIPLAGAPAWEVGPNSQLLWGPTGVCVDLHHHLIGIGLGPARAWDVLSARTVALRLGSGVDVAVLDIPARTLHLALHVAQHGAAERKAMDDLERGLAVIGLEVWHEAALLADELRAGAAFAAGLRLSASGRGGVLADRLGLASQWNVELVLRTVSAPQESLFFTRLGDVHGVRAKVALVARKLWPTPALLRATTPLARRGGWGLAGARVLRPVRLLWRGPPALRAWLDARRWVRQADRPR